MTVYKQGSTGGAVAKIQRLIGVKADGIFGPKTTAAVRVWQRQHNLTPDGIVGPETLGKMFGLPHHPTGIYTPWDWAGSLLSHLHYEDTYTRRLNLVAWAAGEGGHWLNTALYNPLDTTQPEPGASSINSVGVRAYLSWSQGILATITTLTNGYYGPILAALSEGRDIAYAVEHSPWGTHYVPPLDSPYVAFYATRTHRV